MNNLRLRALYFLSVVRLRQWRFAASLLVHFRLCSALALLFAI